MKPGLPTFLVLVNCAILLLAEPAPGAVDWSGWTPSSQAKVVSQDTTHLELAYDTPEFQPIDVRPLRPIPLPDDLQRIHFWFARLTGDFDLYGLVHDAKGTEHEVRTDSSRGTFPGIRRFKLHEWSMWNHAESVSLAIPAPVNERVLPEFRALADASIWPRPLTFSGIRIKPAHDRRDNVARGERDTITAGKGHCAFTNLAFVEQDGFQAKTSWLLVDRWRRGLDSAPRIFIDDLTRRSGELRYTIEARRGYQGPLVWRIDGETVLDRSQPMAVFADRIDLPSFPKGHYFITTKTWLADGTLDTVRHWRLVLEKGMAQSLPAIAPGMHWTTGQPNHVYPADTSEASLALHLPRDGQTNGTACHIRVVDWLQRPVLKQRLDPEPTMEVFCSGLKEGTDYRAIAELRAGGKVLNQAELHFGVANKPRKPGPIPTGMVSRDDLLMSRRAVPIAEHWGSLMSTRYEWEPITVERTRAFDQWVSDVADLGFEYTSFNFGWGEVEPLPGVCRWSEIERRVTLLRKHSLKVLLTAAEWGHRLEWARWVTYDLMLTQHGLPAAQSRTRNPYPSFRDAGTHDAELNWFRAVAERFRDNPTVVGYRTKMGVYLGANKPEFVRSDYGAPMLSGLREWLQERGEEPISIPKLFVLYPYSPARTGPDFSREWQEFCWFRVRSYCQRARKIMTAFRSVDPVRQLHIYRSSTPVACEAAIPLLEDGGEFHDEGGPFYYHRAIESMCLQRGIPYTNEGHQFTPPSKALVDSGFFYGSCYDRGWCWLYRWNIDRPGDPRFRQLPQVLDFLKTSIPHVEEWAGRIGDPPQVLVFGSRAQSLLDDGRHGHFSTIAGIEVFTGLFCYHQTPAHFADEYTDWVDLSRFRVVFAVGETMRKHAIERLVSYAEKGGRLVLVGPAGKFCPDLPQERDLLRRRLEQFSNVRELGAPLIPPSPPGAVSRAPYAFKEQRIDDILEWAKVNRHVRTTSPQFDCLRKHSEDGRRVHVAVFRHWPGNYANVWYDDVSKARWGQVATDVVVNVPDGRWHVEKFHRNTKTIGVRDTQDGCIHFPVDPAAPGELQLFRLSRE